MLRNASIRTKLSILVGVAISSALTLCCAAFFANDIDTLRSAKLRQVESLAAVLGANSLSALDFLDPQAAEETLASLDNQPSVDLAILYDRHGRRFASYPPNATDPLADDAANYIDQADRYIQVIRSIDRPEGAEGPDAELDALLASQEEVPQPATSEAPTTADGRAGSILIRANTAEISQQITERGLAAAGVLAISLAVGLVISRVVQQAITTPINHLVQVSEHIAQRRDYSQRAVKHGDDELGVLCEAFNGMLGEVQSGRTQLQEAHDSLERRVVERTAELTKAMEKAEAAARAKSDFLANMSHELRTPMTAILGYVDLISESESLSDERREQVETIQRNSRHLLAIINDILDLSKIEAGKMPAERVDCNVGEVLADLMSLLRSRAIGKGLQLEVDYRGEIPSKIHNDPLRLRQVLVNLVGNAIKFTESGSIRLTVAMEEPANGAPSRLRFDVADTGIGMTADQLDTVFQAFTQADETMTRRFGGTGLGLTICRGLARLLGGEISVMSEPGVGSTFSVTVETGSLENVPMVTDCREALLGNAPSESPRPKKPARANKIAGKVLLVEDGKDNQRLISLLLSKAGADVSVADNGQIGRDQVLEAWRQGEPYDLVFMDMQMPVLDGYDATSQLRDAGYSLPIVALTAHAMSHERDRCLLVGCDDYFTKPVDRAELISLAAKWIEAGRQRDVADGCLA